MILRDRQLQLHLVRLRSSSCVPGYLHLRPSVWQRQTVRKDALAVVDQIIGGWLFSGTVIKQSGRPFTVYSGMNTLSNVVQSTADCNGCDRDIGSLVLESGRNFWFDPFRSRQVFSSGTWLDWEIPDATSSSPRSTSNGMLRSRRASKSPNVMAFDFRVDARNVLNKPSFRQSNCGH